MKPLTLLAWLLACPVAQAVAGADAINSLANYPNPLIQEPVGLEVAFWLPETTGTTVTQAEGFYPLGWTADSRFAYLTTGTDAAGNLVGRFFVQDLVEDQYLYQDSAIFLKAEDFPAWWQRVKGRWSLILSAYSISRGDQQPVFFPSIFEDGFYEAKTVAVGSRNSLASVSAFQITLTRRYTAHTQQSKVIQTLPAGDFSEAVPFAFLPSPFEDRVAVLVLRKPIRGSAIGTWSVAGADLRAGFQ